MAQRQDTSVAAVTVGAAFSLKSSHASPHVPGGCLAPRTDGNFCSFQFMKGADRQKEETHSEEEVVLPFPMHLISSVGLRTIFPNEQGLGSSAILKFFQDYLGTDPPGQARKWGRSQRGWFGTDALPERASLAARMGRGQSGGGLCTCSQIFCLPVHQCFPETLTHVLKDFIFFLPSFRII